MASRDRLDTNNSPHLPSKHWFVSGSNAPGAAVALSLLALPWRVSTRVIVGWDAGVALYIALIYLVMAHGSIAKIRRRAAINDEGAIALLVLTAAASLASLASVLAELGHSPSP